MRSDGVRRGDGHGQVEHHLDLVSGLHDRDLVKAQDSAGRDAVSLGLCENGLDRLGDLVDGQAEPERDDRRGLREPDVAQLLRGDARVELLARQAGADLARSGPRRLAASTTRVTLTASTARRPRRGEHEPIHHEPGIHAGSQDRDALLLRQRVDPAREPGVVQLGVRELFARRHDVEPGLDRLLDLRDDGVEPGSGAEHHDVGLAAGAGAGAVERAGGGRHGDPRERAVEQAGEGGSGFLGRRIGCSEQGDSLAPGQGLSHLDSDRTRPMSAMRAV